MAASEQSLREEIHTLYSDHHGWLTAWLRRKSGCSERAADLAHDTFVRVMGQGRVAEINQPRAYLTTIARGLLYNWLKRQSLERAYLEIVSQLPAPEAPSPEQNLLIVEALVEVDRLLDALPDKVRTAFLLSQLDGLSYAQIAAKLQVSERTVKRYMVQAFAQCLLAMGED